LETSSLLFVSKNKRKLEEFRILLDNPDLSISDLDIPDLAEMNIEELVRGKIKYAKGVLSKTTPFFVEHTALIIEGWNGLPGGLTKHFIEAVGSAGICRMMKGFKGHERCAKVKSIIGFFDCKRPWLFDGTLDGTIANTPRGTSTGEVFGWDDIFVPVNESLTFAELGQARKNMISMRRKATDDFAIHLNSHYQLI
jgi:non-canonical purine NTP pyrophosphatase (RdgB/HAM1 family)